METHTDDAAQVASAGPSPIANGAAQRGHRARPLTAEGAQYLEMLRALRAGPDGGVRHFNPDETPEEAGERIRRARQWLASLDAGDERGGDDAGALWDEVTEAVRRPRLEFHEIDADVILAAQAQLVAEVAGDAVVVATENARHLAQFVDARRWQEIEG